MTIYRTLEKDGNVYKTFDEWSLIGYKIRKGSKAVWIDNIPFFDKAQVTSYPTRNYDFDREADCEQADYYGISPWGGCG